MGARTHRLHPHEPPHADAAGELPLQELCVYARVATGIVGGEDGVNTNPK